MNLRLKDVREDHDLTQEEISQLIGCNMNTYSSWENGYARIPLTYLDKLSVYYQVPFSYLLGGKRKGKQPQQIKALDRTILHSCMKSERKKRGLTQDVIASILGIAKTTYHDYETGKYDIKIDKLYELAKYYEIDLDVFCGKKNIDDSEKA